MQQQEWFPWLCRLGIGDSLSFKMTCVHDAGADFFFPLKFFIVHTVFFLCEIVNAAAVMSIRKL